MHLQLYNLYTQTSRPGICRLQNISSVRGIHDHSSAVDCQTTAQNVSSKDIQKDMLR